MIDPGQLRYLIRRELDALNPPFATDNAVELLMLTAAAETRCGRWLWQVTPGGQFTKHAYGLFQMEEAGYKETTSALQRYKPSFIVPPRERLITDLRLAIWTARCYYLRFIEPIPHYKNVQHLAKYWKKYWNTEHGAGTAEGAEQKYNEYAVEK